MSPDRYYLTVGRQKRPEGDGYVAVISIGSPQAGDEKVTVLSVDVVPNMKAAKRWYREQMTSKPWESRQ